jgi:hypothetical protein
MDYLDEADHAGTLRTTERNRLVHRWRDEDIPSGLERCEGLLSESARYTTRAPHRARGFPALPGVAADHMGEDPYPYIQKAYDLSPYSRVVVQYACLARLAQLARMSPAVRAGELGKSAKNSLRDIVTHHRALFPNGDIWYGRVESLVATFK